MSWSKYVPPAGLRPRPRERRYGDTRARVLRAPRQGVRGILKLAWDAPNFGETLAW
jgi:hypothetical protein